MKRLLTIIYGAASYLVGFAAFVYAICFLGNIAVPRSIDRGVAAPIGEAVAVNVLLLGVFGAQHSVMARPAFKRLWTRVVPQAIERSTYVGVTGSGAVSAVLAMADNASDHLGCGLVAGPAGSATAVLAGLGNRLGVDVHDQSLRSLRPKAGVPGLAWPALHRTPISFATAVSACASSPHAGIHCRVLGQPKDDRRPPALRNSDHGLHPHCPAVGGTRPDGRVGRSVPRVSRTGAHAVPMAGPPRRA